jgi:hypothetical protein
MVAVRGMFVLTGSFVMSTSRTVMFVQLLGAIGTIKFMALAGNSKHGNGHKKHGE